LRRVRSSGVAMPVGFPQCCDRLTGGAHAGRLSSRLEEMGYVAGRNVAVEYHWMEGDSTGATAMVAELIRRQVAVIFANTPGNLAAKGRQPRSHSFPTGGDPVQMGLVAA